VHAILDRHGLVEQLTRVDLLVLEDFGMKKLGANAAEDLLEVFVRRHEAASTLITTNRPTQDWGVFLGDVPAATAILDPFLAHATIVQMMGKSYRLRQRTSREDD
jgi:DNA replication protein DnaC